MKKVIITIKKKKSRHGHMLEIDWEGKLDTDMARFLIEKAVSEIEERPPFIQWWNWIWRNR